MDMEWLDDDVFCLLDRVVREAEQASKLRAFEAAHADVEDLGLRPVNLLQWRREFQRLRAAPDDPAATQRQGVTLSASDVTASLW